MLNKDIDTLYEIPVYSKDLIKKLNNIIKEECYDISKTKEENIFYSGQRSVVNFLIMIQEHNKDIGE
jgi:hypothetical protein